MGDTAEVKADLSRLIPPDPPVTVHQAWVNVMADVLAVRKTGRNESQGFNFRGIDAVINAVGPATRKHGVIVAPSLLDVQYRDVEVGQKRTLMRECTVRVRYTIFGPAGDVLEHSEDPDFGVVPGESMDSGDKGTAKAMSVAYRTFLIQALMIPTDEPDPDQGSYERAGASTGPEMASPVQVAEFFKAQHRLGPDQEAALRAWFKKERIPPVEKATAEMASAAIVKARELLATVPAPAPEPMGEPEASEDE